MISRILIPALLLAAFLYPATLMGQAEQPKDLPTEKVLIYNFKDTSASTDYSYYTYIIPDSISIELRRQRKFEVQKFPASLDFIEPSEESTEKGRSQIAYLSQRGKEFSAAYIVSGTYRVDNKRIHIKSQVFNVQEQRIVRITETSEELGALLFVILDKITDKINRQLDVFYEEKREQLTASPFIPAYNAMKGVTFGFNYGRAKFLGDWGDIYNDAAPSSLFLRYDFENSASLRNTPVIGQSGISIDYDHITARPDNYNQHLRVYGVTLNYVYNMPVLPDFRLSIAAGGGVAWSKISIPDPIDEGKDPFRDPLAEERSTDPYLNISLYASFFFDPLVLSGGIAFKRVYYTGTPLDMSVCFFGVGFRL